MVSKFKMQNITSQSLVQMIALCQIWWKNSTRLRKKVTWCLVASMHLAALPFSHHNLFSDQYQSSELDWSEIYKENSESS